MVVMSKISQTYRIPHVPLLYSQEVRKPCLVPSPHPRQVIVAGLILQFALQWYQVRAGR